MIELAGRRVHLAGRTAGPGGEWVAEQARISCWSPQQRRTPLRFLIRDRDTKFTPGLDEIFRTEGLQMIRTPFRAPKANAVAERFVRTVRVECLDWLPIAGANSNVRSARSSTTTTPTARTGRSASHPGSRIERRSALPTRTPISVCEDAIGSAG